ncbi:septal ring lytic transglycosylase RlpA family protein [Halomonas sp.]|uniref:septal ring lytic transglycosylase RlpA family protein n=1 Tax=Halomonas sp. TaxID=1486246 RepID=UPI0035679F63
MKAWSLVILVVLLAGCAGGGSVQPHRETSASTAPSTGGRYAMSGDAYPEQPPDVSRVPDAVPRLEPHSRGGNRSTYEVWGKTYRVLPNSRGYAREGKASWYGEKFHGYATSNGEIYDMYKMSAAHRSLPLPTYARVTSLDNGRSVIVRVNDRGPFHSDREIDLSYAAAARLELLDQGTGRVKVEAIEVERWLAKNGRGKQQGSSAQANSVVAAEPAPAVVASIGAPDDREEAEFRSPDPGSADGDVYLQIAALGSAENAMALKRRLETALSHPVRVASASGLYRVQVGPLSRDSQLAPARDELRLAGFDQSFVVKGVD